MQRIFEWMQEQNPLLKRQMSKARRISPWKGTFVTRLPRVRLFDEGIFRIGDAAGLINPVMGGGNSIAINSAVLLAELLSAHKADRVPIARVARQYRYVWGKNFYWRIKLSWIFGAAAHRRLLAEPFIRLFQSSRGSLNKVFDYFHQSVNAQPSMTEI